MFRRAGYLLTLVLLEFFMVYGLQGSPTPTGKAELPKNFTCGLSKATEFGYSYNGEEATMFDHPWQAFLLITFPSSMTVACGGSLIDDRTVLSAAHCFYRNTEWGTEEAARVEVRLGDHNVTAISARHSELIYHLTNDIIDIHPDYKNETLENDIAKVYLSEPVNFSSHPWIHPICLADPNRDYTGSLATATGWGRVDYRKYPDILQQVDLDILSTYDCSQVQRAGRHTRASREKMICASDKTDKGQRMCYGDSGGPLSVLRIGTQQRELLGIVSHGSNNHCIVKGVPDIFTDVTKYIAWINEPDGCPDPQSNICPRNKIFVHKGPKTLPNKNQSCYYRSGCKGYRTDLVKAPTAGSGGSCNPLIYSRPQYQYCCGHWGHFYYNNGTEKSLDDVAFPRCSWMTDKL